ncbi:MAG TPA: MarR family transcriptional regulator [Ruminococcaceae bacterium]|nr:MarR family transcriptional regulator [Oscillospiraceae bacterium]
MESFSFVDRPDNQRLKLMTDLYSKGTPEVSKLFIDFQWTYRNMQKVYDHALNKHGLSESRFIILMFLKNAPNHELLPSVISEKLGATRATVSKLLKVMEAKKWITKRGSTTDKRTISVQLTKAGNTVLEDYLPENFSVIESLFGNLSKEDLIQFSNLLNKIQEGTQKCTRELEMGK